MQVRLNEIHFENIKLKFNIHNLISEHVRKIYFYNFTQIYLPRIGVQDEMFEKLFGVYETRNEPLRLTEWYVFI